MKRIFTTTLLIGLIGLAPLFAQERIYAPALSLPTDGAIDQMPDVVLDWQGVTGGNTGIIKYDVQVDQDPAFPNPTLYQTEFLTAVQSTPLNFGETYYWRVRASDGNDVSDWSETWSFRVIRRVVLTGPNDASTTNDTVMLRWNAITGLEEYDYQMDTVYFWKSVSSGFSFNQTGIYVLDDTHTWVVGAGGHIIFNDGTGWNEQTSDVTSDLKGVDFVDANNGWAVGLSSSITYFNGSAWAQQTADTSVDLYAVSMYDATHGWAVGKSGTKMYYEGTQWVYSHDGTTIQNLNAVEAIDASHVWAGGKSGTLLFYNGSEWTAQAEGLTTKEITSFYFNSADDGWAACKGGVILRYLSGEWTVYSSGLTTKDLLGITFSDPNNGYAVGKTGTLLFYDGIDWSSQSSTTTSNLNAVGFYGDLGYLVGDNGIMIQYNTEAFNSPLAVIRTVPGDKTSVRVNYLLFGAHYFWRMRAKHEFATSEWSGAHSFNTIATLTLTSPNNNATDQDLDQLLKWKQEMSSDVSYEIQIDDNPSFSSPQYHSTSDVSINSSMLKFGMMYYWRVRAMHAYDTSAWCDARTFTTINTVYLTSPADNETDVELSPLLEWDSISGIEGYRVQMSSDNSFNNLLFNSTAETYTFNVPLVLEKNTTYYWRVKAYNVLDTSGWSSTFAFTTLPPLGIDEPNLGAKLHVYPNPAENTVYVQLRDKNAISVHLTLTDLVGKKVLDKNINLNVANKNVAVDVSPLQNGIYILRMEDQKSSLSKKLIIRR